MAHSTTMLFATFILLFVAIIHGSSVAIHVNIELNDLCETLWSYHITPEHCRSALCYDPTLPWVLHTTCLHWWPSSRWPMQLHLERAWRPHSSHLLQRTTPLQKMRTEAAMSSCLDLYTSIIPALQWASNSLLLRGSTTDHGAHEVLNATCFMADGCGGMVESGGLLLNKTSVFLKENNCFGVMTYVTSSIIASILRDRWYVFLDPS